MSLRGTLEVMAATLDHAASVPLSASCVVNRAQMLALVEEARGALPIEVAEASALLEQREQIVAAAEREAERLVADARRRAAELVDGSTIAASARVRAEGILDASRGEARRLLREADDYCDRRLAGLEVELDRTLAQVRRGRDLLRERVEDPQTRAVPEGADQQRVLDLRAVEGGVGHRAGLGPDADLQ